jgi:hypothetical protein
MENKQLPLFEKIFAHLLLISAGLSAFFVVFVIISRFYYPYSVERMEGASLLQVIRILRGQALYIQPSLDYIPLIYPPIYFYLSALAAKFLGLSFAPLRLVSALAFVGCLMFIFLIIESTTKDKYSAFIGTGFFAATYPLSGIWFDVGRVDTLFVFFCVAAIWFSSREDTTALLLSSLFWILTIFTKQTGLIAFIPSFAYLLLTDFRKNIIRLALTGLGSMIAYWVCSMLWGKWFSYFMFYLPTFHQSKTDLAEISVSLAQLILPLALAILISLPPFLLDKRMWSRRQPVLYYGFMTCVLFGLSLLGRLNLGGYTNVYMPAHVMIAAMLGIGLHWWKNRLQFTGPQRSSLFRSVLYLLCLFQFLSLSYDPRSVIPHNTQAKSWSRLEKYIELSEGSVLVPEFNYLAAFANKPSYINQVAFDEVVGEYGNAEPAQSALLNAEITRALQKRQFGLVLLRDTDGTWKQVTNYYQCSPVSLAVNPTGCPYYVVEEYHVCYPANIISK